ncbi:hypothetical protein B0T20DRAFT_484158 [Sordaria brevicollis]|uniref:WSC domain-containing protein n=1 Tax=Sordaria brevicollis TaxID=83679 RepID=A0AAE0U2W9_SORBR|nr:hypothetical protein B0T20DRAFT_484158 [Sordaria brevicollis]
MKYSISLVLAALAANCIVAASHHPFDTLLAKRDNPEIKKKTKAIMGAATPQGCFSDTGDMNLTRTITPDKPWKDPSEPADAEPKTGMSSGLCERICKAADKKSFALANTNECWCGQSYPPLIYETDMKNCNFPCSLYAPDACGGMLSNGTLLYNVWNTGIGLNVMYLSPTVSTTSAAPSSTGTVAPTSSSAGATEPTPSSSESSAPDEEKKGKSNTAGIVAGTVVAVVVVLAIVGGVFLFMRRKRNKEIEDEHRRNAAVNAFIGKPPSTSDGMSMADARLDPVLVQRRLSDGSIADNQDYSRRILRVRA